MNQEFKKLWTDALRSGQYDQGQQRLRTADNRYCCIGVACDVFNKRFASYDNWTDQGRVSWVYGWNGGTAYRSTITFPTPLAEYIGIFPDDTRNLIGMNDAGLTFAQIADWIDANL